MIHIDFILTYFQIYLIFSNTVAFILYGYDKMQAIKNSRNISRVSEKSLLFSTFVGGIVGSLLAMIVFTWTLTKME